MNNSSTNSEHDIVIDAARTAIEDNALIEKGDRVLVALSGGADSVCLLSVLKKLSGELGFEVCAAHLNHMIRGAEADRDEAYAAEFCTALGVGFYAERTDVPAISKERGISEELAGRETRYAFFDRLCECHGFTKVATAHNKNDRAETVLMRMIRGTGIEGLGSIKYKRDNIIRPLLDVERYDIEEYCRREGLKFCTDSTNADSDYTRNRVRNELMPMLRDSFNPSIIDSLCRLADNAAEDAEFINGYANRLYNRINSPLKKKKPVLLDIKSLKMVDKGIRSRLILIAARDVMGDGYRLERVHTEAVTSLLDRETGASEVLPSGLLVSVKYGWLEFITAEEEAERRVRHDFLYEIEAEDTSEIDNLGVKLCITSPEVMPSKNQMILDYDMIEGKMISIRNRRAGDKIVLFSDGRRRKLKDYWIDKKVPREERDKIPLLCVGREIAAIIGDRVAENYKIKKDTKRGLLITYGEYNENR